MDSITTMQFIQREESKPDLEDFTLGEYTEKVIVYGFLMVRKYSVIYLFIISIILLITKLQEC